MAYKENTALSEQGFSSANARYSFNGLPLEGVVAFTDDVTQAVTMNFGAGVNPVSVSKGQKTSTASITMTLATRLQLRKLSPTGSLLDVPRGVFVQIFENYDGATVTRVFNNFMFTQSGLDSNNGDANVQKQISCLFCGCVES